jgi:hypothetical protein
VRVFIITTCIPEDDQPCIPDVFLTLEAARTHADKLMRDEWGRDCTDAEYPGADAAHTALSDQRGWGQYRLTEHEADDNTFVAEHDFEPADDEETV